MSTAQSPSAENMLANGRAEEVRVEHGCFRSHKMDRPTAQIPKWQLNIPWTKTSLAVCAPGTTSRNTSPGVQAARAIKVGAELQKISGLVLLSG